MSIVTDLREVADLAGQELETASAQDVVRWAARTFGARLSVTASMSDAVVVDLVSRHAPGTDVLFLDTGYHFAETLDTRDAVGARYDINLISLTPVQTVAEQDATFGPRLHDRDPDLCCAMRKTAPLERALTGYDSWITGLRRDESPTRAASAVVAFDEKRGKVKVNPIARWTQDDVDAYVSAHNVLLNPLTKDGYASIGCAPCTRRVAYGEDPRAGRWSGLTKTECGIH